MFTFHSKFCRSHTLLYSSWLFASILLFPTLISLAYADVQRFSQFQYDEAGNIVSINTFNQSNLPNVVNITPGFVHIEETVWMTAIGTDLFAAKVTTTAPGLTISSISTSTTQTEVTFELSADQNAVLGPADITFTTGVGSGNQSIIVAEPIPDIITNPNPISIAANAQPSLVQLLFTQPRPTQEIYTLSIVDPLIATVSVASITVPAGATAAEFELSGMSLGTTILNVESAEKFFFFSFPVFVSENFVGGNDILSHSVGVFLSTDAQGQGIDNPLLSQAVGVFLQADAQAQGINNPLLSQAVGVFVQTDAQGQSIDNPLLSQAVGVFLQTDVQGQGINNPLLSQAVGVLVQTDTQIFDNPLLSQPVGVFTGPVINSYTPALLQPGIQTDILLTGAGLVEVTDISIEPAGIITVDGFFSAPDGTTLTVTLSTDLTAAAGDYQMIINSVSGEVTLSQGVRAILSIP